MAGREEATGGRPPEVTAALRRLRDAGGRAEAARRNLEDLLAGRWDGKRWTWLAKRDGVPHLYRLTPFTRVLAAWMGEEPPAPPTPEELEAELERCRWERLRLQAETRALLESWWRKRYPGLHPGGAAEEGRAPGG
ncbi:MAG: hypothetical protein K6U79_09865 [Firmicutes bacterium]|nr:hypothetical protein [Bacillota bacterium]